MFRTKITDMLGVKYPIVGGTMMWISTAEFTAAISNAGGLGVLCSAMFPTREEFARAVERVFEVTNKPFAVNLNLFPAMRPMDNSEYLDVLLEKGVKIVETSGHSAPVELYGRFKQEGLTWIHKCVGVRYALKVQELGADIITVVGYENGGATGKLDIGTLVLVPRVADSVRVPVIGGGGVCDGRSFLAVLSLGAEGVIMGTRLLATQEAPIHDNLKQALLKAQEVDTRLIMRTIGATHRVWDNEAARRCLELEAGQCDLPELINVAAGSKAKKMYDEGDLEVGVISCGQCVGLCDDLPTIQQLFDRIISEAASISARWAASY